MAAASVSTRGVNIGIITPQNSTNPSQFLGQNLNFRLPPRPTISKPRKADCFTLKAQLIDAVHDLFVGVGIGLPCTVMQCGDMIYRSTLPKSDGLTITVPGAILALSALSYLWATPGVAPGFFDMFVLAFVERLFRPTFKKVSSGFVLELAVCLSVTLLWII